MSVSRDMARWDWRALTCSETWAAKGQTFFAYFSVGVSFSQILKLVITVHNFLTQNIQILKAEMTHVPSSS